MADLRRLCMKCFRTFRTNSKYESHYCYFSKNYVCTTCWTEFENIVHFYHHIYQDDKECIGCLKRELATKIRSSPITLPCIKHKCFSTKKSKDKNEQNCLICAYAKKNQSFTFSPNPHSHLYTCTECWKGMDTEMQLKLHISKHTKDRKMIQNCFKCEHCDYSANRKDHLQAHEFKHTGVKPFKCKQCDFSTITMGNLRLHERIHTGVKPFQCKLCNYSSFTKSRLRMHEVIHKTVKPFKCHYCLFCTNRKDNLSAHIMYKHSIDSRIKCKYCDYSTRNLGIMDEHERLHSIHKVIKCKHCDYVTLHMNQLRKHAVKHESVKPFVCKQCDFKSNRKDSLRSHEYTHLDVKPYKCKLCDYSSVSTFRLRTHEIKHH